MEKIKLNGIEKLSVLEKLQLIEDIENSISADEKSLPISDEHKALLDRRIKKHQNSQEKLLTLKEFKKRVKKNVINH